MKIISVVGARPNFMKIAPIMEELSKYEDINSILVHTGQHYDNVMSDVFFKNLKLHKPEICLDIGSASHAVQTAKIMVEFEKILISEKPDMVMLVGDVNSTLAAALTAAKISIRIAHIESGLRSFDRSMPEEINRILTDAVSDYLFTTEKSAVINLVKEGIPESKIFFVGNVMVDTLLKFKQTAKKSSILKKLHLNAKDYLLLTLHRPENVDNTSNLNNIMSALQQIQKYIKVVFPVHPRTMKNLEKYNLRKAYSFLGGYHDNFIMTEPLGYLDFLNLMGESKVVLTDSGGIQEETTVLGIPCVTLRNNTERPVTITEGTNVLAGNITDAIIETALKIISGHAKTGRIPDKWDGLAAKRIVRIIRGVKCF